MTEITEQNAQKAFNDLVQKGITLGLSCGSKEEQKDLINLAHDSEDVNQGNICYVFLSSISHSFKSRVYIYYANINSDKFLYVLQNMGCFSMVYPYFEGFSPRKITSIAIISPGI